VGYSILRVVSIVGLVGLGLGLAGASWGLVFASLGTAFFSFMILRRTATYKKLPDSGKQPFSIRPYIRFALPTAVYALWVFVAMNADLFIVQSMLTDTLTTGYYASASTLSKVSFFILEGMAFIVMPSIAKRASEDDLSGAKDFLFTLLKQSASLGCIIVIGAFLFSDLAITLVFSDIYAPASQYVGFLTFGLCALGLLNVMMQAVIGIGNPTQAVIPAFFAAVGAIAFPVVLIPHLGAIGSAIGIALSSIPSLIVASMILKHNF
jgi:O-antigen/teichoic acid export membrane protein